MDESELIQAVMEAGFDVDMAKDSDAMTTGELAKKTGIGEHRVRVLLKKLISAGYVEAVYVLRDTIRTPLTGKLTKVPGYKVTKTGKEGVEESLVSVS